MAVHNAALYSTSSTSGMQMAGTPTDRLRRSPRRSSQFNENGAVDDSDVQLSHLDDDSPAGPRVTGRQTASPSDLAALCDMLDAEGPVAGSSSCVGSLRIDQLEHDGPGAVLLAVRSQPSMRPPENDPERSFASRTGPAHRLRTPARSILVSSSTAHHAPPASALRGAATGHGVVFVSPEAAEFNAEAPASAMVVRMGRSEAKARFKVRPGWWCARLQQF